MGHLVPRMRGDGPQEAYWRMVEVGELHRRLTEIYPIRRTATDQGIKLFESGLSGFAGIEVMMKAYREHGADAVVFLFEVARAQGLQAPWGKSTPDELKFTEDVFTALRRRYLDSGHFGRYGRERLLDQLQAVATGAEEPASSEQVTVGEWNPPVRVDQASYEAQARASKVVMQALRESLGASGVELVPGVYVMTVE